VERRSIVLMSLMSRTQPETMKHCDMAQGDEATGRWKVRRPRWLLVERAALDAMWRDSQRAYRPWATTAAPVPPLAAVPPPVKV